MEYENSMEGVIYDLGIWGEAVDEDEKNRNIIAETLLELPYKVRSKVLEEVIFVIMATHGLATETVFTASVKKQTSNKMDTIAHEIAHFILGHHSPKPKNI
ncbi:MAG: hypothetical protein SCARUB_01197 [Candidatus Scalindua rubra]|uniref:IrrE N-terminal-like domain-containing protein n=1 Tax=Candidatus Scalindua rubra TaxID=1872076 RepID=A0A1E3XDG0_9BACT|nr:MAG: hypothetical protein SCARUB_01197 [Candidatus Scalindua rubra]